MVSCHVKLWPSCGVRSYEKEGREGAVLLLNVLGDVQGGVLSCEALAKLWCHKLWEGAVLLLNVLGDMQGGVPLMRSFGKFAASESYRMILYEKSRLFSLPSVVCEVVPPLPLCEALALISYGTVEVVPPQNEAQPGH